MIAPRETTVYTPKSFSYGNRQEKPIAKQPIKGRVQSPASSSQKGWRDSNDYREQYFERNKGIGGYVYICSQCWKPIFKRENVQVDHIIPPSRFAKKKKVRGKKGEWVKTSMMARFLNNSFNCAAICPDCNRRKSNKMDYRIIHGYAMKSLEVAYGAGQMILAVPFVVTAFAMWGTRKVVSTAFKLLGKNKGKRR